jgi:5-methylcytosine-specific restriction protein A
VAAVDVDHINGDVTDCRDENLCSKCHSCHSRKTAKENGGCGQPKPPRISQEM